MRRWLMGLAGAISAITAVVVSTLWRAGLHWDQEIALFPWLIRRGWIMYRDVRDQHPPLLPWGLSLLPDPGGAAVQLWATLALVALTLVLTATVTYKLAGTCGVLAAIVAGVSFAGWTLVLGDPHLWYDLALGPFYLCGLLLAQQILRTWRWLPALALGLVMSCAVLVKQHAALGVAGFALMLLLARTEPASPLGAADDAAGGASGGVWPLKARLLGVFGAGLLAPQLLVLLLFALAGSAGDYLYWVWTYNFEGTYAQQGVAQVPTDQWSLLLAFYAPVLALGLTILVSWLNRAATRPLHSWTLWLAMGSLLVGSTLPAWPRYSFFHLAAAIPLLSVCAGLSAGYLATLPGHWFRRNSSAAPSRRPAILTLPASIAALLLLVWSLGWGAYQGARWARQVWRAPAQPEPYSTTAGPLHDWVQGHTAATDPIWIYDLDPTLYRVLEREPARPWTPLYPWIMEGGGTTDAWLNGLATEKPRAALVSAGFAAGQHLLVPDGGRSDNLLRRDYSPGPHFTVRKYSSSPVQEVVVLVRNAP